MKQSPMRYAPVVHVGYWNEATFLEEEKLSSFLEKKANYGLRIQKTNKLLSLAFSEIELTRNHDGYIHDGDIVMIKCSIQDLHLACTPSLPEPSEPEVEVFKSPCLVTATSYQRSCGRTAFVIRRVERNLPLAVPLRYGEPFIICATPQVGDLKLHSNHATVHKYARRSRHQEVILQTELSPQCQWKCIYADPKYRMEMESDAVPVNTDLIISHVYTGKHLALEEGCFIRSIFGVETEVSGHNHTTQYRVELPPNIWQIQAPLADLLTYDTNLRLPGQETISPYYVPKATEEDQCEDANENNIKTSE